MISKQEIDKFKKDNPKYKTMSNAGIASLIVKERKRSTVSTQQPQQQNNRNIFQKAGDVIPGAVKGFASGVMGAARTAGDVLGTAGAGIAQGLGLNENALSNRRQVSQLAAQQQQSAEGKITSGARKIGLDTESTGGKIGQFGGEMAAYSLMTAPFGAAAGAARGVQAARGLATAAKVAQPSLAARGTALAGRSIAETALYNASQGQDLSTGGKSGYGLNLAADTMFGVLGKAYSKVKNIVGSTDDIIKKSAYEAVKPGKQMLKKDIKRTVQKEIAGETLQRVGASAAEKKAAQEVVTDWAEPWSTTLANKFKSKEIPTLDEKKLYKQTMEKIGELSPAVEDIVAANKTVKADASVMKSILKKDEDIQKILSAPDVYKTAESKLRKSLIAAWNNMIPEKIIKKDTPLREVLKTFDSADFTVDQVYKLADKFYEYTPKKTLMSATADSDNLVANILLTLGTTANESIGNTLPQYAKQLSDLSFWKTTLTPLENQMAAFANKVPGTISWNQAVLGAGAYAMGGWPLAAGVETYNFMARNPVMKSKAARFIGGVGENIDPNTRRVIGQGLRGGRGYIQRSLTPNM